MNQEDMMSQIYGIIRDHAAQHGRASDDGQLRINYNQAEAMVSQFNLNSIALFIPNPYLLPVHPVIISLYNLESSLIYTPRNITLNYTLVYPFYLSLFTRY